MAHLNNEGEIVLTIDDKDELNGRNRVDMGHLINRLIWGNKKHFYQKNNDNHAEITRNQKPSIGTPHLS